MLRPRAATTEKEIHFTRVEIEVDDGSVLAGRAIRDSVQELPGGVVIGAITRDDEFVIPSVRGVPVGVREHRTDGRVRLFGQLLGLLREEP
jgi:hypothetical protein